MDENHIIVSVIAKRPSEIGKISDEVGQLLHALQKNIAGMQADMDKKKEERLRLQGIEPNGAAGEGGHPNPQPKQKHESVAQQRPDLCECNSLGPSYGSGAMVCSRIPLDIE